MSDPKIFNIQYNINPWMKGNLGKANSDLATKQWLTLKKAIETIARVEVIPSRELLPDLVFTANAALLDKNKCILSHFKCSERRGEESIFHNWFKQQNFHIITMPKNIFFEGAGDALFSVNGNTLWLGYGYRSDLASADILSTELVNTVINPLKLVNPYFYHLDTCFCPLELGHVMYYPQALDNKANQDIKSYYAKSKRIEVSEADAKSFCCNAVCIKASLQQGFEATVILNDCSRELEEQLNISGYNVIKTPTSEFIKSGGATKCLTLKIPSLD